MRPPLHLARIAIAVAFAGIIAFLALRTSPYVQYVPWMPRRLGVWADSNGILRNTVAFFGFAAVVFALLGPRAVIVGVLCVFGAAVEIAQLWIPGRVFDPRDIAASVAGVLLAWPIGWAWQRWRNAPH